MKFDKIIWLALATVAIMWLVAAWYYPQLPDTVPIHWDTQGQADNYMNKPWGALIVPLISSGVLLLSLVLPALSPKGFRLDTASRAYAIVVTIIMLFMIGVMVLSFQQTLGKLESFDQWIAAGLGLLFLVLGNYLGKFPKNFWVGIRTPWTLASDVVWFKTHRFGGRTFMAGGVLVVAAALGGMAMEFLLGIILVAALAPVVYSLFLYRRMHGFKPENNE